MASTALVSTGSSDEPIRKAVRRLRWFKQSFAGQVDRIADASGVCYEIDQRKLTTVFVDWLRAFDQQKPNDPDQRRAFVGFAAGLMLRFLTEHKPLGVSSLPEAADMTNPAFFWPEGYVYVAFCLNIRAAVLEQDFHEERAEVPALSELRTWWSFKENVNEDPRLGIAFLDLFAGEDPDWVHPDVFSVKPANQITAPFYRQSIADL